MQEKNNQHDLKSIKNVQTLKQKLKYAIKIIIMQINHKQKCKLFCPIANISKNDKNKIF